MGLESRLIRELCPGPSITAHFLQLDCVTKTLHDAVLTSHAARAALSTARPLSRSTHSVWSLYWQQYERAKSSVEIIISRHFGRISGTRGLPLSRSAKRLDGTSLHPRVTRRPSRATSCKTEVFDYVSGRAYSPSQGSGVATAQENPNTELLCWRMANPFLDRQQLVSR